jgi:hypothetical protein
MMDDRLPRTIGDKYVLNETTMKYELTPKGKEWAKRIRDNARYYLSLPKHEWIKHLRDVKKRHPLVMP